MTSQRHSFDCRRGEASGFTLIEIMTVVAVIGVIAAIAIPSFLKARTKARVTTAISDLRAFEQALKAYNLENGTYPEYVITEPVVMWGPGMLPPPLEGYSEEKDWTGTTPCGGNYELGPYVLVDNGRHYVKIVGGKPIMLRALATEINANTATNLASKVLYEDAVADTLHYFIETATP